MSKLIAILFDRMVIHGYTSQVTLSTLQNRGSPITNLIIIIISLLIWFSSGLILAYWVKRALKKRNTMFFLILLTSFIGFIIYIVIFYSETGTLEDVKIFTEIDEMIEEEEEAEFYDKIEEISEKEVEDIIEIFLKDATIETD